MNTHDFRPLRQEGARSVATLVDSTSESCSFCGRTAAGRVWRCPSSCQRYVGARRRIRGIDLVDALHRQGIY